MRLVMSNEPLREAGQMIVGDGGDVDRNVVFQSLEVDELPGLVVSKSQAYARTLVMKARG